MIHRLFISKTFCESSSLQQVASSKHHATIWKKTAHRNLGLFGSVRGVQNPSNVLFFLFVSEAKNWWLWFSDDLFVAFFFWMGSDPGDDTVCFIFCILLNGKWLTSHLWRSPWNFVGELFQPGPRWKELVASSDRFFALFSSRLGSLLYPKNPWIQWKVFFFTIAGVLWGGPQTSHFWKGLDSEGISKWTYTPCKDVFYSIVVECRFWTLPTSPRKSWSDLLPRPKLYLLWINLNFILGCLGSEHFLCRFFSQGVGWRIHAKLWGFCTKRTAVIDTYFLK